MLKPLLSCILSLGLATLSLATAQSARGELFDQKKSLQELEVMRGILSTTLSFVMKELRGQDSSKEPGDEVFTFALKGGTTITSFYLYGQGAVFLVPASSLRTYAKKIAYFGGEAELASELGKLEAERSAFEKTYTSEHPKVVELKAKIAETEARLQDEIGGVPGGVQGGVVGGVVGGVPGGVGGGGGKGAGRGVPQEPKRTEDMRKKLADAQEKVKKQREMDETRRAKVLEQIGQIKGYLIEALANHGDSLTQVKPNEYLNIVISTDDAENVYPGFSFTMSSARRRDVISVQKSAITDYKAGKLSLEAFKQKVFQYTN